MDWKKDLQMDWKELHWLKYIVLNVTWNNSLLNMCLSHHSLWYFTESSALAADIKYNECGPATKSPPVTSCHL